MGGWLNRSKPTIALAAFLLVSCGTSKTEIATEIARDHYEGRFSFVQLIEFKKLNGYEGNKNGFITYTMDGEVTLELTKRVIMDNSFGGFTCSNLIRADSWVGRTTLRYASSVKKAYDVGHTFKEAVTITLKKSDKGWVAL